jgi:hypothetical protein
MTTSISLAFDRGALDVVDNRGKAMMENLKLEVAGLHVWTTYTAGMKPCPAESLARHEHIGQRQRIQKTRREAKMRLHGLNF